METIDCRTFKEKIIGLKEKAKEKVENTKKKISNWCKRNPDIILGTVIIVGPTLIKTISKSVIRAQEEREEQRDYYDPRTGEHWYTRRPLKSKEKLELERRYNCGESKGEILESMRLL